MVDILPLNGLRYNRNKIPEISKVIAPPYDIISPEMKGALKLQNFYNIVNLTLPDDTENKTRYEVARDTLNNWIENDILIFEENKSFYLIEESFTENGILKKFSGFVGLVKVEDYGKGKILRHEKTLPKPKEDRLNLLRKCRTNFEFIYTLYNDSSNEINYALQKYLDCEADVSTNAEYDNTLGFRMWKINDAETIKKIIDLMKNKTLLIADGHHRYETSRLYKEEIKKNEESSPNKIKASHKVSTGDDIFLPEDYVLTLFVASNQKDIIIHPTHRVIKFNNTLAPEVLKTKIKEYFEIENITNFNEELINEKMIGSKSKGLKSLVVYFSNKDSFFITLKNDIEIAYKKLELKEENFDFEYENLDVNILHKLLLGILLSPYEIGDIKFLHTIQEVIEDVVNAEFDAGFILNAPDIGVVEDLSLRGEIMPQKSTYFYPKPCSGMVLYKF
ncbi:MAG: DUF1015 domain-containing protein [Actinobacteria bacterium]|nr:DUF1015 domain-containing protein [Actinomycetota bacterium]